MACHDCEKEFKSYQLNQDDCAALRASKCSPLDSTCVVYTGAPLSCLGVLESDYLENILLKIDEKVCIATGEGFGGYNLYCLTDDITIDTQQEFAEKVAFEICELQTEVAAITTGIDITDLTNTVDGILNPGLTSCPYLGVISSDTINQVLTKIITGVCTTHASTDITGVNWSQAFNVLTPPTTIPGGFNEVVRQIALLKTSFAPVALPTFNTTSSCLPTKNTTTPLSTVVSELITLVCASTLAYNYQDVSWGCVTSPVNNSLSNSFNTIVQTVNTLVDQQSVYDSNHFDVLPQGTCDGNYVSISASITDEIGKVKASATGTSDYVHNIIEAGAGITLDTTDPNKLTISSTGVPGSDGRVKVDAASNSVYLNEAITGGTTGALSISVNQQTDSLQVVPSVDYDVLADQIIESIKANPVLLQKLCNLLCACADCK